MTTMNVREKLVEQLREVASKTPPICRYDNPDEIEHFGKTITVYCKPFEQFQELMRDAADYIANGVTVQEWISVDEKLPQNFISVLGYMTDAGEFPPVRECYTVGNVFFFPALGDIHPVSHWREMPQPPKGE